MASLDPAARQSAGPLRPLTVYLVLLVTLPSTMVITALGFVGGPAIVFGILILAVGLLQFLSRTTASAGAGSTVELAIKVMLVIQLLAYAHSAWLPLPADERTVADAALISMASCSAVGLLAARIDVKELVSFSKRLSVVVGLLAFLGLLQLLTGEIFVDLLSVPGLSPPVLEGLQVRGGGVRPTGTSTNALEYASLMVMALPLVLVTAGAPSRRRPLYIASAGLVSLVILLSGSRTSLVCGLVAFIALLPAWSRITRFAATGVLLAATVALFVVRPGFIGSVTELFGGASADPGVQSRTNSYEIVWRYASAHPWLGRGPGTFLPKYWIVDNQYLQSLLGSGIVGLVAFVGLIVVAVVATSRAAERASAPLERQITVAVRAGILAGATSFAFFDAFSFTQAVGLFFIMIGLAAATERSTSDADRPLLAMSLLR